MEYLIVILGLNAFGALVATIGICEKESTAFLVGLFIVLISVLGAINTIGPKLGPNSKAIKTLRIVETNHPGAVPTAVFQLENPAPTPGSFNFDKAF